MLNFKKQELFSINCHLTRCRIWKHARIWIRIFDDDDDDERELLLCIVKKRLQLWSRFVCYSIIYTVNNSLVIARLFTIDSTGKNSYQHRHEVGQCGWFISTVHYMFDEWFWINNQNRHTEKLNHTRKCAEQQRLRTKMGKHNDLRE